jgi:hypothetical protein
MSCGLIIVQFRLAWRRLSSLSTRVGFLEHRPLPQGDGAHRGSPRTRGPVAPRSTACSQSEAESADPCVADACPPSWAHGPSCPRRSAPASWRWSRPPGGEAVPDELSGYWVGEEAKPAMAVELPKSENALMTKCGSKIRRHQATASSQLGSAWNWARSRSS